MAQKTCNTDTTAWFVAHTRCNQERLCAEALERKGFDVYLPMKTVRVSHARRAQVVTRPLFGRYLFVGLDHVTPAFSAVRKSLGVEWIVQNGANPVRVRNVLIDGLREAEEAGAFDETRPQVVTCSVAPGDTVRIKDGPCAGLIAEIVATPSERRIELLLKSAGHRPPKIVLPLARMERVA